MSDSYTPPEGAIDITRFNDSRYRYLLPNGRVIEGDLIEPQRYMGNTCIIDNFKRRDD